MDTPEQMERGTSKGTYRERNEEPKENIRHIPQELNQTDTGGEPMSLPQLLAAQNGLGNCVFFLENSSVF